MREMQNFLNALQLPLTDLALTCLVADVSEPMSHASTIQIQCSVTKHPTLVEFVIDDPIGKALYQAYLFEIRYSSRQNRNSLLGRNKF